MGTSHPGTGTLAGTQAVWGWDLLLLREDLGGQDISLDFYLLQVGVDQPLLHLRLSYQCRCGCLFITVVVGLLLSEVSGGSR